MMAQGTFKVSCYLDGFPRKGGRRKETREGEIVCDGVFGIHGERPACLTHIPTGRSVGWFPNADVARKCAKALIAIDLPWQATTLKEWRRGRNDARGTARAFVKRFQERA